MDEPPVSPAAETSQPDSEPEGVTVAPTASQATALAQGSNSIGQIAPFIAIAPGHLTALFNPDSAFDDGSGHSPRNGDLSVNQPVEVTRAVVPDPGLESSKTAEPIVTVSANPVANLTTGDVEPPVIGTQESKLLLPQAAGLIANALPFDETALEHAVDQFFDQLEELGMGQIVESGPTHVIPLSLAMLGTITAAEVARRRLRSRNTESQGTGQIYPLGSEELLGFPELPGSWSTNMT